METSCPVKPLLMDEFETSLAEAVYLLHEDSIELNMSLPVCGFTVSTPVWRSHWLISVEDHCMAKGCLWT